MKKVYTEPEFEITRFSFQEKMMSDLTWHSQLESNGYGGNIYEDGEPIVNPFDGDPGANVP